jgi:hypothetical protein
MTTLFLVAQGVKVVAQGKHRRVAPHWFGGASYLKIGWSWGKIALQNHRLLLTQFALPGESNPSDLASRSHLLGY